MTKTRRLFVKGAVRYGTLALTVAFAIQGQTLINLGNQGKNIDFGNAPSTRPEKTGTALPAICSIGDMFFNSSEPAGQNLYGCTGANTWSLLSSGLSDPGANGLVLRTGLDATSAVPAPSGVIVGTTDVQTLTNKSIDAGQITGTLAPGRLPAPSGTALGGVESITPVSHNWVDSISTSGVAHQSQPNFTDLLGALTISQTPLTTSQDILFDNSGSLGRLPISAVTSGQCLGNNNGAWGSFACSGGGNQVWSSLTNPGANVSLLMASYTSLFTFGSTTGANDLFKWTDSANNTGTGALGHFTTAQGSSAIPWQADANGAGWIVNSQGQLQGIGSTNAGMVAFAQGSAPTSFPSNSFALYAPSSIGASYQWIIPGSDAAGAIVSDGNGTPGHLSIVGFSGTGNIARVASPSFTGTTTVSNLVVSGACTGCGAGGGLNAPAATGPMKYTGGANTAQATGDDFAGILQCAANSGSGSAYTCNTSPTFTPAAQDMILFKTDVASTGAATLSVNSSTAAPITKQGGSTPLIANDLLAGQWTILIYDGTNWEMQGSVGNSSGGSSAVFAGGGYGSMSASGTKYGAAAGMPALTASESLVQEPNPVTGTLKNLSVCIASAQPSSGSLVVTVRKAGISTALALTIAASAAAGCYSDNSDTVASSRGDLLSIQLNNGASTTTGNVSWSFIEQ